MTLITNGALRTFLGSISVIAAAGLGTSASAQWSTLNGTVAADGTGTFQQVHQNVPFATLTGLETVDAIGNVAKAGGSLSTPEGRITLSSHACSGGGPGFGGNANGTAHGQVILDYLVKSSTLPNGTPVSINIGWAISSSVMAVAQNLEGINSGAIGSATGAISVTINGVSVLSVSGSYTRTHSVGGGGITNQSSGTLQVQGDEGDHIYNVLVGQVIRIYFDGNAGSSSSAAGTSQTDGDVQMALLWGLTSLNPDATVVWFNDQIEPAPPAADATLENAQAAKPPRPPYLMPCFELPTQPVAAISCVSGSPGFGVAVHGTGPFTYQWQIQSSPETWVDLDSDPVALPCGGSATSPNATAAQVNVNVTPCPGVTTYEIRAVITNPCGTIASNIVTLDLCIADIDCNGIVGVPDLLAVINGWGPCGRPPATCNADIATPTVTTNGDGTVGVPDLLRVINGWGMCQ